LKLPEFYVDWQDFVDDIKPTIEEMSEDTETVAHDERVLDVLTQGIPKNPIIENFRFRNNVYDGYELPSDNLLKNVYQKVKSGLFTDATTLMAGFYDIGSPNIETKKTLPASAFVFYDLTNSTIMFDLDKLSEFWMKLPAFFLGFFRHLPLSKNWKFDSNPENSPSLEKKEAELFSQECVKRLLELGFDARKE